MLEITLILIKLADGLDQAEQDDSDSDSTSVGEEEEDSDVDYEEEDQSDKGDNSCVRDHNSDTDQIS